MNAVRRILPILMGTLVLVGCAARQDLAVEPGGPGSDQRPQAVTLRAVESAVTLAPLPDGSRIATPKEATGKAPASLPADPNLVDRHLTYVVPLGLNDAVAWFGAHPAAGFEQTAKGAEKGRAGVISASLVFSGASTRAYDFLAEGVAVYPLDDTHAVVRIDGSAIWYPSTVNDRAPTDATGLRVTRVLRAGATPHSYSLSAAEARKLAVVLNRQRAYTDAPIACPNDNGGYDVLHFVGPGAAPTFRLEGCGLIVRTNGHPGSSTLSGGGEVKAALDRILASK